MNTQWWREWCYPELTTHENALIAIARKRGYATFFPNASAQALATLSGAVSFLDLDNPATFFDSALQTEIDGIVSEIAVATIAEKKLEGKRRIRAARRGK